MVKMFNFLVLLGLLWFIIGFMWYFVNIACYGTLLCTFNIFWVKNKVFVLETILGCPEHHLTIFGKCLSVRDKHFLASIAPKRMRQFSLNFTFSALWQILVSTNLDEICSKSGYAFGFFQNYWVNQI